MDIWETDKLLLFIAFVVPGFISLKTYELLFPRAPKSSADQLIDAVAYSSINYALLLWPLYEIETHGIKELHPTVYILFYVFVLLIAPILWACVLRKMRTTKFAQRAMPHPTAKPWDYVFGQQKPYWVVVTLKDGRQIAGLYAEESFASSAPAAEQLYLQETWVMSSGGGFERPRVESAGIMILAPDIVTVEFFNITRGDRHAQREPQPPVRGEGVPAAASTHARRRAGRVSTDYERESATDGAAAERPVSAPKA